MLRWVFSCVGVPVPPLAPVVVTCSAEDSAPYAQETAYGRRTLPGWPSRFLSFVTLPLRMEVCWRRAEFCRR